MKVIETKTRGPINQLMAEAKRGSMVIKSLGAESFWKERFRKAQTDNIKAFYGIKRCDRFLSVRLESLANVMVFATALLSTKVAKSAGELTAVTLPMIIVRTRISMQDAPPL